VEYVDFVERPVLGLIMECRERQLLLMEEVRGMEVEESIV